MTQAIGATCPEKFTVHWLLSKLANVPALDTEADRLLYLAHQQQPDTVLDLMSGNTSTVALIKLWLQEGDLPCYSRGKQIEYPPPVPEIIDLDALLSSAPRRGPQSYDSDIWIKRDELSARMVSVGLPLPEWLGCIPAPENLTKPNIERANAGQPVEILPAKKRKNGADWDARIALLVDALIQCEFDPQDLPATAPREPGPRSMVQPILKAAGLTDSVIMDTWTNAYKAGRVKGGGLTSVKKYQND